jgi:hypothetical protein
VAAKLKNDKQTTETAGRNLLKTLFIVILQKITEGIVEKNYCV